MAQNVNCWQEWELSEDFHQQIFQTNKSNPKVFLCLRIIKSNNATLFHQFTLFERFLAECNINIHYILHLLTCTLIFPIDVLQVKAIMALADVTPKCVDALTETGTNRMACGTFIHICTTNTQIHHFSTFSSSSRDQSKKVSVN